MKKKALFALCTAFIAASLTACSPAGRGESLADRIKGAIKDSSGINDDADYLSYRADLAAGKVVNGYFHDPDSPVDPDFSELTVPDGKAVITFAQNSMLNAHYYLDEEHTTEINDPYHNSIFLGSGESLYAEVEKINGSTPSKYIFSDFRIINANDGKIINEGYDEKTGLIFTAPENCGGLEISVEPVGKYEKKTITLDDYYTDDTFTQIAAGGTWMIGNEKFTAGEASIASLGHYLTSYEFDSDKYFFVSSEPKYTRLNENTVVFGNRSSSDEISGYKVELHPFISAVLTAADTSAKAFVNGEAAGSFAKGEEIKLDHLKFGDTVSIKCGKKSELKYDKMILSPVKSNDTFAEYTFTVKEQSEDFTFDPNDFEFEHGKVTFSYLGNPITGKISLAAGRLIEYSEAEADEGYWLPDGDNVITVSEDPEETMKQIEKIRFYRKKLVTVTLPQPSAGGTVTYKKGERTLSGKTDKMYAGTELKLTFNPWNGWEKTVEGDTFTVSDESDNQTVTIDGVNVKDIFREVKEHRPVLKVIADRLVGTDMRFSVRTSDISETELSRDIKNNVMLEASTGTADGVYISVDAGRIAKSQMVKLSVSKTDSSGNEVTDVIYLEEIPSEKKIDIYPQGALSDSDIYYKNITVTVSTVFRQLHEARSYENASLTLKYADTVDRKTIAAGELLDRDRLVTVFFKPADGYYISGQNVNDNVYSETMKYSEYQQAADKLGKTYPRKRIYTVDLNTSDPYGKVVYTLNGKTVSGKTQVREEDKLVMTYTIENRDYIIYKDFLSAMHDLLSKSPYERSETITITEDLDGTSVTREDFITVQKREK